MSADQITNKVETVEKSNVATATLDQHLFKDVLTTMSQKPADGARANFQPGGDGASGSSADHLPGLQLTDCGRGDSHGSAGGSARPTNDSASGSDRSGGHQASEAKVEHHSAWSKGVKIVAHPETTPAPVPVETRKFGQHG